MGPSPERISRGCQGEHSVKIIIMVLLLLAKLSTEPSQAVGQQLRMRSLLCYLEVCYIFGGKGVLKRIKNTKKCSS